MLYIIYGKDREKGRKRFHALCDELRKKCGEEYVVHEDELSESFLNSAISSQGLFGSTTLYVFDCVFDKKLQQETLLSCGNILASSPNSFLIFEPALEKTITGDLKEIGAMTEEYVQKKIDARPEFNIFSLGDALGRRNKKEFWVLYQEALASGLSGEEICNTLFWAIKNIALMKNAKMGDDCGINSFVASKARVFANNYTQEEITKLSHSLVTIYHEDHRGGEPMNIALERFILNL